MKDQGVGIPSHDIRRVFEPFYTGENGRKFGESTGMGLYLVHEVCKKLDHKIEIESELGDGTSVRIIFVIEAPSPKINPKTAPSWEFCSSSRFLNCF